MRPRQDRQPDRVGVLSQRGLDDLLRRLMQPGVVTSMPASRSARATTLAPRSCPSRPGLATMIRSGPGAATGASDVTGAKPLRGKIRQMQRRALPGLPRALAVAVTKWPPAWRRDGVGHRPPGDYPLGLLSGPATRTIHRTISVASAPSNEAWSTTASPPRRRRSCWFTASSTTTRSSPCCTGRCVVAGLHRILLRLRPIHPGHPAAAHCSARPSTGWPPTRL